MSLESCADDSIQTYGWGWKNMHYEELSEIISVHQMLLGWSGQGRWNRKDMYTCGKNYKYEQNCSHETWRDYHLVGDLGVQ